MAGLAAGGEKRGWAVLDRQAEGGGPEVAQGIRRVGILTNPDKPQGLPLAARLVRWLLARDLDALALPEVALELPAGAQAEPLHQLAATADILVVLGGDGTLLGTARRTAANSPLLLGVNLGHLGFLTEVEEGELFAALPGIVAGGFEVDERMMLTCEVHGPQGVVDRWIALNDVVLTKGPFARLLQLRLAAGDREVITYPGDGLIFATPTGSTAYSLSAGGPVVHPQVEGILVTPICAHTLYARPLLLSARERLVLDASAPSGPSRVEVALTVDAQEGRPLAPGERVVVAVAPHRTRLVRRTGWNFYEVLRHKLAEDDRLGLERQDG